MSSGSLPESKYHRAQSLGAGSFGSVMIVYDDDGAEFALKIFEDDDDDDDDSVDSLYSNLLDIGTLREISSLRLLRDSNAHPNIIQMHDIQIPNNDDDDDDDDDENKFHTNTSGSMGLIMPVYHTGSLATVIKSGMLSRDRRAKIEIAHGILSAVAHLHDNGILHRDIKLDNIMLDNPDGYSSSTCYRPVLIDFSLAKIINDATGMYPGIISSSSSSTIANNNEGDGTTHTPHAGTPTYRSPEVSSQKSYSFPSDLWSVGVVLLELLRDAELAAESDRTAGHLIREALETLPSNKPFPDLIRGLLKVDPNERLTARDALQSPLFEKLGLERRPPLRIINVDEALPLEVGGDDEEEENAPARSNAGRKSSIDPKLSRRWKRVKRMCHDLECDNPFTAFAAYSYSRAMEQIDDEIDGNQSSQTLMDCVVLANRFWEVETYDLTELRDREDGIWGVWDVDDYKDNEMTIFMIMDYCLYPRRTWEVGGGGFCR